MWARIFEYCHENSNRYERIAQYPVFAPVNSKSVLQFLVWPPGRSSVQPSIAPCPDCSSLSPSSSFLSSSSSFCHPISPSVFFSSPLPINTFLLKLSHNSDKNKSVKANLKWLGCFCKCIKNNKYHVYYQWDYSSEPTSIVQCFWPEHAVRH